MKKLVTKVDIHVSDDGGSCDPTCPFLVPGGVFGGEAACTAFHKPVNGNQRTVGCMGREDCTYQIPVVEE